MSAHQLVRDLLARGVELTLVEGHIHWKARKGAMTEADIARLRASRVEIQSALGRSPPTAEDWREFFEERAAIIEFDGGVDRQEAERRAFECCVVDWLNANRPVQNDPEHCLHCGMALNAYNAIAVVADPSERLWLHHRCHGAWLDRRKNMAVAALRDCSLVPPGYSHG